MRILTYIDTGSVRHDEDRYSVYKAVLPKFAILKSITYQEKMK
jgi:hypothetical protein